MSLITVRPQLRPDKHYVFAPSQSILPRCCLCFFDRELPEILPSDIAFDFPRRHDACTTLAPRVHLAPSHTHRAHTMPRQARTLRLHRACTLHAP